MNEKRVYNGEVAKLRAYRSEDGKKMYIEGYAAVFGKLSQLIVDWDGEYYEQIERNAFDKVLEREDLDVVFTVNHNFENIPVARYTKSKKKNSLSLTVDDYGLRYVAQVANTSLGRDLFESVERGDIDGNSFVFTIERDEWSYDSLNGFDIRTVKEVKNLYDVSAVVFPAYHDAKMVEVDRRSYDEFKKKDSQVEQVTVPSSTEEQVVEVAENEDYKRELEHDEMFLQLLKIKSI